MITINLLPDEYRRRAKSPIGMIAAIAAAVLINASLIAYYGYLEFGTSRNIETNRSVLQLDLDGLKPQVVYHEQLEKEKQTRSARETTLAEITRNRILWTRALDEIVDIVHAGRDGIEHFIWFEDVDVKVEAAGGARGGQSFGQLKASGRSGSEDFAQLTNFLEAVEDPELSSLMAIFDKPTAPEAKVNPRDEELIPAVNWSFPMEMKLLSPEQRVLNREAAKKEAKQ